MIQLINRLADSTAAFIGSNPIGACGLLFGLLMTVMFLCASVEVYCERKEREYREHAFSVALDRVVADLEKEAR